MCYLLFKIRGYAPFTMQVSIFFMQGEARFSMGMQLWTNVDNLLTFDKIKPPFVDNSVEAVYKQAIMHPKSVE